jgi:hypothetical protein
MYIVELGGDPFSKDHALSVTADDGTYQAIYIDRSSDETATIVWDHPGGPESFRRAVTDGMFQKSTVLLDE